MSSLKNPISLQSYAYQLRKKLINGSSLENLLDCHQNHQEFLAKLAPIINSSHLSPADRFAWKFIREINILNISFTREANNRISHLDIIDSMPQKKVNVTSGGVYQNLTDIIDKVQAIWFPEMNDSPNVVWLKHFSTRKLAHYSFKRDEIAFSLIFDSLEAPPEILSYLAYHELLHRQVGLQQVNGRIYTHTKEFKSQEILFPNSEKIDKEIAEYIINTE